MTTKTEEGMEFPSEAYAYVGDPEKVDTWKLRLWETPEKKVTVAQLGRAAAAFSPGGFRGQKVDLRAEVVAGVKAKIRAEYKKLGEQAPASVAASAGGPQFIITLAEVPAEGLVRTPLAKIYQGYWRGQKIKITRADLAAMVANFRKRTADVVVDYGHGTLSDTAGPVPAAGWLKAIEDAPDERGILWGSVEFTAKAREMLAAKEYRYISPVIFWGVRDKATGVQQGATLKSVALEHDPQIEELEVPAIALSGAGLIEDEGQQEAMMLKKLVLADRAAGTVRAILEDDTESTLVVEGLTPEVKAVALSEVGRTADGRLDFAALSESQRPIAPEVMRAMFVGQELDAAVAAGKITPAQRPVLEKLPLTDLRTFIASAKQQIDLGERGLAGDGGEGGELAKVEAQIETKVAEKRQAVQGLDYIGALKLVCSAEPALWARKLQLQRKEARD
jgi:phage I-like protein